MALIKFVLDFILCFTVLKENTNSELINCYNCEAIVCDCSVIFVSIMMILPVSECTYK